MKEYLVPYIISNAASIILLFLALKWKKASRMIFGSIFLAAGIFNTYQSGVDAGVYVNAYGETAWLQLYKYLIYQVLDSNPEVYIQLIAAWQLFCGITLFFKSPMYHIGIIGGMIFLTGIAPLGMGSAFPSTLIMAVALYFTGRTKRINLS